MKILIADDDEVSRIKLASVLKRAGYEVVSAADGIGAWTVLQSVDGPRLVILDWMMPGLDGPAVCRKARTLPESDYVYIILLTSRDTREDLLAGMEAGADDFVRKPFNAQELQARVRVGKRILDLQESLRIQATRDSLTDVWNRRVILETLEGETLRAVRTGNSLAIAILDLDHFKRVNDTHGHQAGDVVLQETARRMATSLRSYDALGRYGGEEFLAVLPGCDEAEAVRLGERLRHCVAAAPTDTPQGLISVTVSVGVATLPGGETTSAAALLLRADNALYRAKQEGRNCVVLADGEEVLLHEDSAR